MKLELTWSRLVDDAETSRDTADPLGFRTFAGQLARDLVPGLTQVTNKARGFSLLALGLRWAREYVDAKELNPTEAFLRFERMWVGAQVLHHGPDTPFAGKRMASTLLKGSDESYPLTRPLTSTQIHSGLWGAYRRASVHFGLVSRGGGRRSGPTESELTPRGRRLAEALKKSSFKERVRWSSCIGEEDVALARLEDIEREGHKPSKEEVSVLTEAFVETDRQVDHAMARLRRFFDAEEDLSLDALADGKGLSDAQRAAVQAARTLVELMQAIEEPYRSWVTSGENAEVPGDIWKHPGWGDVESWPAPDLLHLREVAQGARGRKAVLEKIHEHHRWLAEQRGSEPWDEGIDLPARRKFEPPDFCLGAAGRLFADGVLEGGAR